LLSLTESRAAQSQSGPTSANEIDRLAALDEIAWQAVYDEYFLQLRNFAFARIGDLTESEDIASEVFASALRGIQSYRDRGAPFGAWLFRIARNVTTDHLRRRGRRREAALPSEEISGNFGSFTTLENQDELRRVLRRLTEEQQTVIGLRFFADCSIEEAAKAMNKSVHSVKGLQQRALASMRRHLIAAEAKA
jgi:RNA polymerase sigma-70 factor (ECF subfamily)